MKELTISEVARRTGIRPSALRYYESVHLLPEPRRTGGQRRYDETVVERLAFIQTAKRLGFTLIEIQQLFSDQRGQPPLRERWQIMAHQKIDEVKTLLQRAQTMQQLLEQSLNCDCLELDGCIDCVLMQCQE